MSTTIPPDERLLDLVIALVNTSTRLTKEQVRRTVAGYADAPTPDAFERMFERDKDTLRELGVPLVTVTDAGHGDDIGYRIDLEAYALPPIDLTPAELGVLSLAAQLWQDASLRVDSARALTKLRAVAPSAQSSDLVAGLAARVRAGGAALAPLVDALHQRRAVRFTYRAATTGEVRERHVEPWRLMARRGGWVLIGHDRDRGAARSFRLSRIEGPVRALGPVEAFDPPDPALLAQAEQAWSTGRGGVAVLALAPERAEALRARALPAEPGDLQAAPGRDVVRVPFRATWELAEEVVGYGPAVLVLSPPQVRSAVLALLTRAAALGQVPRG
ncbi:helix-turn-helix transcriptional regulator [Cellulomonas citrea]|uniref:helix-turn-helix transcriptional regulator n=1 Tax=Cellulomonas citrea TaxID=1909423 RepID=UPI0013576A0B|nr:WYL domain-containing protein [Cellulomonas citrea]